MRNTARLFVVFAVRSAPVLGKRLAPICDRFVSPKSNLFRKNTKASPKSPERATFPNSELVAN
jgi:hypothetical protein